MPNLEGKITSRELSSALLEKIESASSGGSYKVDIPSYDWAIEGNLRTASVKHNLNGDVISVSAYDTSTKDNIFLSYKIIDGNNIKLFNTVAVNTTVIIAGNGKITGIELTSNIDDVNVSVDTVWSSSKSKNYVDTKFNTISTDAAGTSFDNKTNGMTATNVQDAIEENKTQLNNLQTTVGGSVATLRTEQDRFVDLIY